MAIVYVNGHFINSDEAVVSVYDHGFLYGLGLFETFATYNGKCFLLDRHLQRLEQSCAQLGITYTLTIRQVEDIVEKLRIANKLEEAYVRLTVSAGEGELGLPTTDYMNPTIIVMVKPLSRLSYDQWIIGKKLQQLHTKRNTPESTYRFKSLHYMNNIVAKRELISLGEQAAGAEGLMLNEQGWLTEGIVSNLFFVLDKEIYTPHIATGILPGITRQYCMELARALGYTVKEGYYTFKQLQQSSEIWMTNSIQEIIPITRLIDVNGNEQLISKGEVGAICKQLFAEYRAYT